METRSRYQSKAMQGRRDTVLRVARELIASQDIDGFTMKQLAKVAGVSTATLFNIYGSRDKLVNEAVLDAFHSSMGEEVSNFPETIAALDCYIDWTCDQIVALGNYIAVIAKIYFSQELENEARAILLRETTLPYAYFIGAHRGSLLAKEVDSQEFAELVANQIFAHMNDWAAGRIDEAAMRRLIRVSIFATLIPALAPPAQEQMAAMLKTTY